MAKSAHASEGFAGLGGLSAQGGTIGAMALPKNETRRIVVNGTACSWTVSPGYMKRPSKLRTFLVSDWRRFLNTTMNTKRPHTALGKL
jgi:hypothetical protein